MRTRTGLTDHGPDHQHAARTAHPRGRARRGSVTSLEAERHLARLRPRLHATPAALDSVPFLRRFARPRRERLVVRLLTNASVGLLPDRARTELGIHRPAPVRNGWDRPLATVVGRTLPWGLGPSQVQAAARGRQAGAAGMTSGCSERPAAARCDGRGKPAVNRPLPDARVSGVRRRDRSRVRPHRWRP
ncbi:oxygenase MpaB family protein [Streptomyces anulatus]|uniref:oxygenase MpaB family protein n=1 Tax=Streptomyces anulatus TaxID=1892 RepID=UPI002D21DD05|nr:oxygenase MpaB family protein [Streptomyces anulatus]